MNMSNSKKYLQTDYFPYVFFEGNVVPKEQAVVPIMTNALQYGTGFFGGIRAYYNSDHNSVYVFRLDDHLKRFLQSATIIGVDMPYNVQQTKNIIIDLTRKNNPQTDTYYRPFGYASSTNLSPNLNRDRQFEFALYMMPLGDYLPTNKGISVMVSSWRRITDSTIPSRAKISGGYINSALAKKEANDYGFEEAIMLNDSGHVAEGSAMNFCIVRDGVLVTPPVSDDILEGIVRKSIITIAKDLDIPTQERSIDRSELYIADEAFFTGTGAQVSWIAQIDKRTIGTGNMGKITNKVREAFFSIVRGENKNYSNWLTKIPITQP